MPCTGLSSGPVGLGGLLSIGNKAGVQSHRGTCAASLGVVNLGKGLGRDSSFQV